MERDFLKINKLFTDVVKWAEDFSIFLSREKTNAERCLHDCERLLNDPNVTGQAHDMFSRLFPNTNLQIFAIIYVSVYHR